MQLKLKTIGVVQNEFLEAIPQGWETALHRIVLDPQWIPALEGIEGFSHLYVIWVFDRVTEVCLTATPPNDDRPHGVLATRAPVRPNPIGLTVVELIGRDGPRLRVRGLDMLDGTPILDIKPYLSSIAPEKLRRGWLAEAEARRAGR